MNGESTYQPDFVVVDEDNLESKKENPPVADKVNKQEPLDNDFNQREIDFVNKQRHKLRVINPKGVYFFRHITISYFHSAIHLLSLLVSGYIIFNFLLMVNMDDKVLVKGIGWVNNENLIEKITQLIISVVLIIQLKALIGLEKTKGLKRYKLAMIANAVNRTVLNYFKFLSLCLASLMVFLLAADSTRKFNISFNTLSNGTFADLFIPFASLIAVIVIVRAFRFCGKGVAE
jgi:hypothetical protein